MRRTASGFFLTVVLVGTLLSTFKVVGATAEGPVYIRSDGSVDPADAPIQRIGDIYTLVGNIYTMTVGIDVEKDNIVMDGDGYTLHGRGYYSADPGVRLFQRENVTVRNVQIRDFAYGIMLDSSSNITITGNSLLGNADGVRFGYSSCFNTVNGNTIVGRNGYWNGIVLYGHCNGSIFSGNDIANNGYGIVLSTFCANNNFTGNNIRANNVNSVYLMSSSTNNSFSENVMVDSQYEGIVLESGSNFNSFVANDVTNNGRAIRIFYSSQNKFFLNRFFNNSEQVVYDIFGFVNIWDNGYPAGGNYWSEHPGVDLYSGAFQNETGSDGIDDDPFIIDSRNQDHYPFAIHNMVITDVLPFRTIIGAGNSISFKVTTSNRGDYTECFGVSLCIDDTAVDAKEVTLSRRNSTSIILTWNTSGFAEGGYTLTAVIEAVPFEMSVADNILSGRTVRVITFTPNPGDINGDGAVDIVDFVRIASKWGMTYPNAAWDPDADVNDDEIIDIVDIVIVAAHYGALQ